MSENVKPAEEQVKTKGKPNVEEMASLDLEIKKLELEEKKANLQDVQERLAERQIGRDAKRQNAVTNGITMNQTQARDRQFQSQCNHKKGSMGHQGYTTGQGVSDQFAVMKHVMMNGDMWIRCMRCGKTWKPPVEENFYFDGAGKQVPPKADHIGSLSKPANATFDKTKFDAALAEYKGAVEFNTRNSPSKSAIWQFSDGGKLFRDIMNSVTLR